MFYQSIPIPNQKSVYLSRNCRFVCDINHNNLITLPVDEKTIVENGSGAHYHDFWVYAVNPDKGAGKGARTLQLRFDRDNYRRSLSSYGKIFGAKNSK